MTESEARSKIKYRIETARQIAGNGIDGKAFEDLEIAVRVLKEIREYREIGTVEELRVAKRMYDKFCESSKDALKASKDKENEFKEKMRKAFGGF